MSLLPIHIISGSIAIIAGYTAIFALKGARLHRKSGAVFTYAMIGLGWYRVRSQSFRTTRAPATATAG